MFQKRNCVIGLIVPGEYEILNRIYWTLCTLIPYLVSSGLIPRVRYLSPALVAVYRDRVGSGHSVQLLQTTGSHMLLLWMVAQNTFCAFEGKGPSFRIKIIIFDDWNVNHWRSNYPFITFTYEKRILSDHLLIKKSGVVVTDALWEFLADVLR